MIVFIEPFGTQEQMEIAKRAMNLNGFVVRARGIGGRNRGDGVMSGGVRRGLGGRLGPGSALIVTGWQCGSKSQ